MKKILFIIALVYATSANAQYYQNGVMYFPSPQEFQQQLDRYYGNQLKNNPPKFNFTPVESNSPSTTNTPSTTTSSKSTTTTTTRQKYPCTICNQTGRVVKTMYLGGRAKDKYCDECRCRVPAGHYHTRCSYCSGKGYTY